VIGKQKLTTEARRRGEQPSQAGVELGIPGIELCKPFRFLVEVGGGRGQGIATVADIARDRRGEKKARHFPAGLLSILDRSLLHRIPIRIYFVDLAQVQLADAGFHLVHVTDDHPHQMVWQDELFGDLIGGCRR
jgi:hypothetical protein